MAYPWLGMIGEAAYAGYAAARAVFRKEAFHSFPAAATAFNRSDDYGLWDYRQLRYQLYWAMWENSVYDSIHAWSARLKADYGLYRHIRGCYNPAYRLGEFYATHLMGGTLDPAAGDGRGVPSALPIETDNAALRQAIARIWKDSAWQVNKTVLCRIGAVCGDVAIKVCDDEEKRRVLFEVVHPASLPWVSRDTRGHVRAYLIRERRPNPEFDPRQPRSERNREFSVYEEYCTREAGGVRYTTLRDYQPYDWHGRGAEWLAPYPFVPLVLVQHTKVDPNESFGVSEFGPGLPKFNESSDLASSLHDQIRKTVQGAWFVAGMRPPKDGSNPLAQARTATRDNPEPDRTDVPVLYGGMGATATPLVLPLQIQATAQEIQNQNRDIEIDYPELFHLRVAVTGDASGAARREARKPAEAKVMDRRVGYDDPLVHALGMGIAIGGYRGYDAFDGFNFESYEKGDLDFRIGNRPVFNVDVMDDLARKQLFWTVEATAVGSGYPRRLFLEDEGYTEEQLRKYDAELQHQVDRNIAAEAKLAEARAAAIAAAAPTAPPVAAVAPANGQAK